MTPFKENLYTPGRQTLGKPEIIRTDQAAQSEHDSVVTRQRELAARLAAVRAEIDSLISGLGRWIFEGCDHTDFTDRLLDLRAESEALEAGIKYADNRLEIIKRSRPVVSR